MGKTKILQYTIKGELVAEYDSIKLAAVLTGLNAKSISRCCSGKRKSYNNHIWIRAQDADNARPRINFYKSDIIDLQGEAWRDIAGYEGLYQVSSMGRIKSLERIVHSKPICRFIRERIMSFELDKDGYKKVQLCKNGIRQHKFIHRLVCATFVENPMGAAEVNHINGIKDDNRVENLEWCSRSENERHAYSTGLAKGQKGYLRPTAKPIRITHIITNQTLDFGCIADCARFIGGKQLNTEAAIRGRAYGKI